MEKVKSLLRKASSAGQENKEKRKSVAAQSKTTAPVAEETQGNTAAAAASNTGGTKFPAKCHCGQTTWEVTLTDDQKSHVLCHCDTCKILSGGAFTLNQVIPRTNLTLLTGTPLQIYTYHGDSGKAVNCFYCSKCTTHVYHHQEVMGPDTIIARTAQIEAGRKEFGVSAEIYGKAKMKWEKEVAQTFEGMPPA